MKSKFVEKSVFNIINDELISIESNAVYQDAEPVSYDPEWRSTESKNGEYICVNCRQIYIHLNDKTV